jgi:hypothetical protein
MKKGQKKIDLLKYFFPIIIIISSFFLYLNFQFLVQNPIIFVLIPIWTISLSFAYSKKNIRKERIFTWLILITFLVIYFNFYASPFIIFAATPTPSPPSVSHSPEPQKGGSAITFSSNAQPGAPGELIKLLICKTNTAGCVLNSQWGYRKPITISNSGSSALTYYQVLVTLDTSSLISTGKMRSNCGDIRFTDSDGSTLLNYWLESGCNSANTKIWVKVPYIPASSTKTIYVYYGNPSATSTSTYSFISLNITKSSGNTYGAPIVLEDIIFNVSLNFSVTQVGIYHTGDRTYDLYNTTQTLSSVTLPNRGTTWTWDYWLPNIFYMGRRIQLRQVNGDSSNQFASRFLTLNLTSYPVNTNITVLEEAGGNAYGGVIVKITFSQPMKIFINRLDLNYIADANGRIYLKNSTGHIIWSVDPPDQSTWSWRSFLVNTQIMDREFYFEMTPTGNSLNQFAGDRVYLVIIGQIPLISVGAEEVLSASNFIYTQSSAVSSNPSATYTCPSCQYSNNTYYGVAYSVNESVWTAFTTAKSFVCKMEVSPAGSCSCSNNTQCYNPCNVNWGTYYDGYCYNSKCYDAIPGSAFGLAQSCLAGTILNHETSSQRYANVNGRLYYCKGSDNSVSPYPFVFSISPGSLAGNCKCLSDGKWACPTGIIPIRGGRIKII